MKFRTELKIEPSGLLLKSEESMVFLGSCFSDHIGGRLSELGLPVLSNPLGVVFHPFPLLGLIEAALQNDFEYSDSDLFFSEGRYYSLAHHGKYSGDSPGELLDRLNMDLKLLRTSLEKSSILCLTLGTAWGYNYEKKVVANCHKLPQSFFEKKLTSAEEIRNRLEEIVVALQRQYKKLKIVLTVSPVRHVKDGLVENNRSKAQLLSAVHSVVERMDDAHYFPSYELVIDDLRDYRFFKSDMVHPSEQAIDYVQSSFEEWGFSDELKSLIKELAKYSKLKNHKVLSNSESVVNSHSLLLKEKKEKLEQKYPYLKL